MIMDKELVFSGFDPVTRTPSGDDLSAGGLAAYDSANVLDCGTAGSAYESLFLVCKVLSVFNGPAPATVNIQLVTADNSTFTTNSQVMYDSGALPLAALQTQQAMPVLTRLPVKMRRFAKIHYIISNGPLTTGRIDAFLVRDVDVPVPMY